MINLRLRKLKSTFKKLGIDGYIIPKNDEFFSEYAYPDRLRAISNFSGSAGFSIITHWLNYLFVDGRYLIQSKIESGKDFGMEVSSTRALTIRRIEGGILGNLTDMDTTMTPFEAGLGQVIDLDKGAFIGQKALINSDKRALLFGFTCESAVPVAGSIVYERDIKEPLGQITAGVPSPTLGLGIGYVRFLMPGDWIGRSLSICLPDNTTHIGKIVETPFFDAEKNIVTGKDRRIPVKVTGKFL